MVKLKARVEAELENIKRILEELEKVKDRENKELVEVVGIGAYIQNIYSGMENIIKQILIDLDVRIPDSPTWHKDLLKLACKHKIINEEMFEEIGQYLLFRHFFMHSYGFLIQEEKLSPLMNNISQLFLKFKEKIDTFIVNK